jgi:hypothetical protein
MKETRIEFRISHKEKRELDKLSKKYDYSLSEYIRRKLFIENYDYDEFNERYVSPEADKNNLINITVNYKILYMLTKLFANLDINNEALEEIEAEALDYARQERLKYGYRVIKS